MRSTKELLSRLKDEHLEKHKLKQSADEDHKVVYFVLTNKIEAAKTKHRLLAEALHQTMADAHIAKVAQAFPEVIDCDPAGCIVQFFSKPEAQKAAQFLADLNGYWLGHSVGSETIEDGHLLGKAIRCKIDHPCLFHDPNGLLDFDFTNEKVDNIIAVPRDRHQLAKRYLNIFSRIIDQGIVPDWPYNDAERDRIWKTHQAKVALIHLVMTSCSERKPHPEKAGPLYRISFCKEEAGVDIMVDGAIPTKFTPAAKRAALALALEPDLARINTRKFCEAYDPTWADSRFGTKNIPKKFKQAMDALKKVLFHLQSESLGGGKARVSGITFEKRPTATALKNQIKVLCRVLDS